MCLLIRNFRSSQTMHQALIETSYVGANDLRDRIIEYDVGFHRSLLGFDIHE